MHTTALPNDARIAVIGGGPAGIATAKELAERGFAVQVLEASDDLGGQWHTGAAHSGIWPGMRANTSGVMTRFSDRPAPDGWPVFPTAEQVRDELPRPRCTHRRRHADALRGACPVGAPGRRALVPRRGGRRDGPHRHAAGRRRRRRVRALHRAADPGGAAVRGRCRGPPLQRLPWAGAVRGPPGPRGRQLDLRPGDRLRPRARSHDHGRELVAPAALDRPQADRGRARRPRRLHRVRRAARPVAPARGARGRAARAAGVVGRRPSGRRRAHPGARPPGRGPEPEPALPAARRRGPHRRAAGHRRRRGRRRALHRRDGGDRRRRRARHRLRVRAALPRRASPRRWRR